MTEDIKQNKVQELLVNEQEVQLSKAEILIKLKEILNNEKKIEKVKEIFDLKTKIFLLHKTELSELKNKFIEEGVKNEHFIPPKDEIFEEFISIFNNFNAEYQKIKQESAQDEKANYETKLGIIEEIKELASGKKGIKATKKAFSDLIEKYKSIGYVPLNVNKPLQQKYYFAINLYNNYIKLTEELKTLSLQKNLQLKLDICKQAEEIQKEKLTNENFHKLQELHEVWKNIGPIPEEETEIVWTRFKEATKDINKKHREFFLKIKDEQKDNLLKKTELCEKLEAIVNLECVKINDWKNRTQEILEIQNEWKKTGAAKKSKNAILFKQYRKLCDSFFDKKHKFFEQHTEEFDTNIAQKEAICIEAESIMNDKNWEATNKKFRALNARWKEIGIIPFSKSKKLWERFQAASDVFYGRKKDAISDSLVSQKENLANKLELIEKITTTVLDDEQKKKPLLTFINFLEEWKKIGFVPIQEKENIQNKLNIAINSIYKQLDIPANEVNLLRYKIKLIVLSHEPNKENALYKEEFFIRTNLSKMITQLQTYESNISYIQKSKNSEKIIEDIQNKTNETRELIESLEKKLILIDQAKKNKLN